ncbi:hypothetical protein BT93_H2207 [Corymbia citriodora subsp. variegata]|nr:hypothetical protein BT93_H2207 [Corymbia citriodora subsp. variegata]
MPTMSTPSLIPFFLPTFILCLASFAPSPAMAAGPPPTKPSPLVFPIRKDAAVSQYYTTLQLGTPPAAMNVVLDLAGEYTWLDCSAYESSSYRPVHCNSSRCEAAGGLSCNGCYGLARPGCTNDTCGVYAASPFLDVILSSDLAEDVLVLHSPDGIKYKPASKYQKFAFSCLYNGAGWSKGLSKSTKGIVALARNPASLPAEFSAGLHLPHTFALCLPSFSSSGSSHGNLYVGGGPYMRPPTNQDLVKTLLRTQLLVNPVKRAPVYSEGEPSDEYFIDVTAIEVDSALITFKSSILAINKDGVGGTKIGTLTPYTVLHSAIFRPLVNEFTKKAMDRKIKKAAPVAPFGACFDANTVKTGPAGPNVPAIVLVLRGDTRWRMEGANSMVRTSQGVMCLGFVDGGSKPRTSIVIGGHQMEDILVEFDVGSSTFGFSNSLLLQNSSCSSRT